MIIVHPWPRKPIGDELRSLPPEKMLVAKQALLDVRQGSRL